MENLQHQKSLQAFASQALTNEDLKSYLLREYRQLNEAGALKFIENLEKEEHEKREYYKIEKATLSKIKACVILSDGCLYGRDFEKIIRQEVERFIYVEKKEAEEIAENYYNDTKKALFVDTCRKYASGDISKDEAREIFWASKMSDWRLSRNGRALKTLDKIEKSKACKSYTAEKGLKIATDDAERDYWKDLSTSEELYKTYCGLRNAKTLNNY